MKTFGIFLKFLYANSFSYILKTKQTNKQTDKQTNKRNKTKNQNKQINRQKVTSVKQNPTKL